MDPISTDVAAALQAGRLLEVSGNVAGARGEYAKAWTAANTELDACFAAHYLSRVAPSADDRLEWSTVAIQKANATAHDVTELRPALLLQLAMAFVDIGDMSRARTEYEVALALAVELPDDDYARNLIADIRGRLGLPDIG